MNYPNIDDTDVICKGSIEDGQQIFDQQVQLKLQAHASSGPKIVMFGLDLAGKTTIFDNLTGADCCGRPTGFNVDQMICKDVCFTLLDVDVGQSFRRYWKLFMTDMRGLIYVVDSSDRRRIKEARDALMLVLQLDGDLSTDLLIFANKEDLPNAMSIAEIADKLGLNSLRNRRWLVQSTRATTGKGLNEGLHWLISFD